ncbi:MAG TPA: ATP-binding cassette domain-containing protein, partial [Nevskiaceae bacterium]|nr:ATP-binding cassette domain-containing protein [Nevskiaceae bacterium]
MISLTNATLRRGARTLLENVSFTIFSGQHVGIVGKNGTGKSSLFQLLLGQLHTDAGDASMPKNLAIATVAQETPGLPVPALEYALDGDVELRQLERDLAVAEEKHDGDAISHIHERLLQIDGYAARARAAQLLRGLGFAPDVQENAVESFSGGWRMRLNLARALMCRSDLMLLDEPTNHLDLDAVIWLAEWLGNYPGTLLLISHDREFLDSITTHTLHLENQTATLYAGNYSQFERQRAERMTQQAARYEKQERERAHLQSFIDRFKTHASKARQAQSRVKALERMELIAPAHWDSEFSFSFREPERVPSPLLTFDDVAAGYGDARIVERVRLSLEPTDRIGLLGPNGAGKSTLMRTLAGVQEPLAGDTHRDPYLKIGYFAQHQLEQLDAKASPLLHLKRISPRSYEQDLRDFLGSFGFNGDRVSEAVAPFSGGEKARLALALIVFQRPNLLLLDEPTNHLDLEMRYAVEAALAEFKGAVIMVSHDRHMLTSCCNEFWRVAEGRCEKFDGDLDDYARWLQQRLKADPAAKESTPRPQKMSARDQRKAGADARAAQAALKKLEAKLEKLGAELKSVMDALGDEALYAPERKKDLSELLNRQSQLKRQLAQAEEEWLEKSEG